MEVLAALGVSSEALVDLSEPIRVKPGSISACFKSYTFYMDIRHTIIYIKETKKRKRKRQRQRKRSTQEGVRDSPAGVVL